MSPDTDNDFLLIIIFAFSYKNLEITEYCGTVIGLNWGGAGSVLLNPWLKWMTSRESDGPTRLSYDDLSYPIGFI